MGRNNLRKQIKLAIRIDTDSIGENKIIRRTVKTRNIEFWRIKIISAILKDRVVEECEC